MSPDGNGRGFPVALRALGGFRGNYGSSRRAPLPIPRGIDGSSPTPTETQMRPKDIYDDMPDGEAQRAHNQRRLAELERDGAARRARIAELLTLTELCGQAVQPSLRHAA
jgi:hypothetical protein